MDVVLCRKANVKAIDEFDSCLDNINSLGDFEDSPDRSQNEEIISLSQYAISKLKGNDINDADVNIYIVVEAEVDESTLPVFLPRCISCASSPTTFNSALIVTPNKSSFVLFPSPISPSPAFVSLYVGASQATTTNSNTCPTRRKRMQSMNVSVEGIFLKEQRNSIALVFERQTVIKTRHESLILAWENERHDDDRLYNEQCEDNHEAQRSRRDKARRDEKEEARKR